MYINELTAMITCYDILYFCLRMLELYLQIMLSDIGILHAKSDTVPTSLALNGILKGINCSLFKVPGL